MRGKKHTAAILALLVLFVFVACINLAPLEENVCGNFAVDPSEDCDGPNIGNAVCVAPELANECRLMCQFGEANVCPLGWGCGIENVCHAGSGNFVLSTSVMDVGTRLQSADFNGDHLGDVLVSNESDDGLTITTPRVMFSSVEGLGPALDTVSTSALPSPGNIDPDGGPAQILIPVVGIDTGTAAPGLVVFRASEEDTLTPQLFTTGVDGFNLWPVRVKGVNGIISGAQTLIFANAIAKGETELRMISGAALNTWPRKLIRGTPVTARFDMRSSAPCESIVFAFESDSLARVVNVCDSNGVIAASAIEKELDVDGMSLVFAPQVLDFNSDQKLDIILVSKFGSTATESWVFFGDGKGHFGSRPGIDDDKPARVRLFSEPFQVQPDGGLLGTDAGRIQTFDFSSLLSSVVDSTGRLVLVQSQGIARVGTDFLIGDAGIVGSFEQIVDINVGSWARAVTGDINSDGTTDIVASAVGRQDLDVYVQVDGLFNPRTLRTSAQVTGVTLGEFDGDGVNDVAWIERRSDAAVRTIESHAHGAQGARASAQNIVVDGGRP
jgi:hypothetical protein